MRRWLVGIAAGLTLMIPGLCPASFVVSPMEHHLTVTPGSQSAATVTVHNAGEKPLTLRLYFQDSRIDGRGVETDLPAGALARSCASWAALSEAVIDLVPREVRAVTVTLSVPDSARGSYWTKLYLEEMSTPVSHKKQIHDRAYSIFIKQQVGVRLFCDVAGTERIGALVNSVIIHQEPKAPRSIVTRVVNTGNTLLRCRGRVEIRDSAGGVIQTLLMGIDGEFYVFPDGYRDLPTKSDTPLAEGTYTALAIVDFGGDHVVAGEEVLRIREDGLLAGARAEGAKP